MSEPTRIRAQAGADKATVRMLMTHEMESGQRKDASGKIIPAWFMGYFIPKSWVMRLVMALK